VVRVENKLIWASFYYCILMFLWIGIPFTASFAAEMFIFRDLIIVDPSYIVIAALAFIFLAMAILNALQEYVFNPDSIFIHRDTQISIYGHIILIACIGLNILNGFAPSWLINQIRLLGI
jgi:NADH:ubiquinone oxidoreductase subunit 4 (subunit M)